MIESISKRVVRPRKSMTFPPKSWRSAVAKKNDSLSVLFEPAEEFLPVISRPVTPGAVIRLGCRLHAEELGILRQIELLPKIVMPAIPDEPRHEIADLPANPGGWIRPWDNQIERAAAADLAQSFFHIVRLGPAPNREQ